VRTQNTNDQSLVLQVLHRDISFLFTGDIERPAEDWMANHYGALIGSTILNVPHHGSRTSSTESFLTRVCPRVAVVSVGRGNRFGLPSKAVMDRYRGLGIPVLRTDLHGAIGVRSDGREVVVQPYSHSKEESEDSSWGRPVDAQDALSP
jgi:competence protein ComEC